MRFAIRVLFVAGLLAILLGPGASSAWSRQVQISYSAEVVTVTGTPFGLANTKGKIMTGYFWYDTLTKDTAPETNRGLYDHSLSFAGFSGLLDGTTFMGSRTQQVIIENTNAIDTFRFLDGAEAKYPNRIMTANGVALSTAQLSFAITSDKNPLNGVKLPDPFPFSAANPHTFSLGDKNGQMLLQLRTIRDASPAPPGDVSVKISLTDKRARFRVDGGVYSDTKTFTWPQGSTHIIDFPVGEDFRQYSQLQNSRWSFGGWSEQSGALDISGSYSATIVANPDLEIVGSVGGFQHIFQMNFFGETIDLTGASGPVTTAPTCGTASTGNPDTLRSGRVIMDGTCYWQSYRTWMGEGGHTFTAFPYPGFAFLGWLGGGANLTAQARTVNVLAPTVLETVFTPARRVRFLTEPNSMQVTVDDVTVIPEPDSCPTLPVATPVGIKPPCVGEFDFAPQSAHRLIVASPQRDRFGRPWIFDAFSNGMVSNSLYTVGPISFNDNFDTLIAKFVPGVSSIISSKPIGVAIDINGKSSTTEYNVFKPGEAVALSAPTTAAVNGRRYSFLRWSDGGAREHTATIPKDAGESFNLFAEYSVESQILIDSRTPNATVLVDGQRCALPCAVNGNPGQDVRIEPAPEASLSPSQRIEFVRWSDGGARARIETLAGQDSRTLTAEFNNYFQLQATTEPGNGATFTTAPASADLFFPEGTEVTVNATTKGGFQFNRWSGDTSGTQPTTSLKLDAPRRALAVLDRVPFLAENPVRNAATNLPGPVAPGSVVAIVGESLAFEFVQGPDNPLSQAIYGTSAAVDYYRFLPLKFVSPQLIQAVLPSDLTPGQHVISVRRSGYEEVISKFVVAAVGPGLFQAGEEAPTALGHHADGTPITNANPALPGEEVTVLGTGFGPYLQPPADGQTLPAAPPYLLATEVEVVLAGHSLDNANAAGQPGQAGVAGIRFKIPANSGGGAVELKARVSGQESPAVVLPIGAAAENSAVATGAQSE